MLNKFIGEYSQHWGCFVFAIFGVERHTFQN